MPPLIRNYRKVYQPGGPSVRLVSLEDNPPTCTMTYSVIAPGKTSSHHLHPWEHEVFILEGSGALVCDGREYPIAAGDAMLIPANVDHVTRNTGRTSIRRIEVNPLAASRNPSAAVQGVRGTGQPPVVRNLRQIDQSDGPARPILNAADGAVNYIMAFRSLDPGSVAPNHVHPAEHLAYMMEGGCDLVVDGRAYPVQEGDAVLVQPNAAHEWRSNSPRRAAWLVLTPDSGTFRPPALPQK